MIRHKAWLGEFCKYELDWIVLKSLLRPIWQRRHELLHTTRNVGGWIFASLNHLPVPSYVKEHAKDVTMLAVDQLIVKTETYQHWQRRGNAMSRLQFINSDSADETSPEEIKAPTSKQWAALTHSDHKQTTAKATTTKEIDVIIPIYKGHNETLNAIYHAVRSKTSNQTSFHITVINDGSPDNALVSKLASLSEARHFTLLHNDENMGFVGTVNKGMALHPARDVILLNADTEVYGNWLDRLMACKEHHQLERIATITPLSNNADLCSYPNFLHDNSSQKDMGWRHIDQLTAEVNAQKTVMAPTAVGFCMYIAREALNEVGLFDQDMFGYGYGEENDFCMRAAQKGYKHLIACDVLVRHIGGTSFGKARKKRTINAYDKVSRLHPEYPSLVKQFITDDPLMQYRRALDIARLKKHLTTTNNILMISHALGGGTKRHVDELTHALMKEQAGAITLQPHTRASNYICITHPVFGALPNLTFSIDNEFDSFIETLKTLHIKHLHIHHLVGYPAHMIDFIYRVAGELSLNYDMTLHDYYTICPRINLLNKNNQYCQEPDLAACESCISGSHSHANGQPVWLWRQRHASMLNKARRIYVPNADVAERVARYYPLENVHVMPHAETFNTHPKLHSARDRHEPLRIAVIGAINTYAKGMDILAKAVEDCQRRNLAIHYTLIGHSDYRGLKSNESNLTVSGAYKEDEIESLLTTHKPHLIFIPSIWPETYSYTLSIAFKYGIKVVAFDIGAQAQRIKAAGEGDVGHVLPLSLSHNPTALNDILLTLAPPSSHDMIPKPDNVEYKNYLSEYYQLFS